MPFQVYMLSLKYEIQTAEREEEKPKSRKIER